MGKRKKKDKKKSQTIDDSILSYVGEMHSQNLAMMDCVSGLCQALVDEKKDALEREAEEKARNREFYSEIVEMLSSHGAVEFVAKKIFDFFGKSEAAKGKRDSSEEKDSASVG